MILTIIKIIIFIVLVWFFLANVLGYILLPNFLFKTRIRKNKELEKVANKLKSKNKKETLKKIYDYVNSRYFGVEQKFKLIIIPRLFRLDIENLLKEKNLFLACHVQNNIIRTLLINSGQFKEKDIQKRGGLTGWLTIHQYLKVRVDKKMFKIDPFYNIFKEVV